MGTSTNGLIFYGIAFDEEHEFPWSTEFEEIEDWWIYGFHGFKHSFELFDAEGGYLNGREPSKEESGRYFAESRLFFENNPLPVELVNYCSGDCPMYALAARGSVITAKRGHPIEFDPRSLSVADDASDVILKFCSDHGIQPPKPPEWLLASYWG